MAATVAAALGWALVGLAQALLFTAVATDAAKTMVGKPRPNFSHPLHARMQMDTLPVGAHAGRRQACASVCRDPAEHARRSLPLLNIHIESEELKASEEEMRADKVQTRA